MKLADAVAIGFAGIGEEHLFTFLLSSPMTARTLARQQGQVEEVRRDLDIALALSIGFALLLAALFRSRPTALLGTAFGLVLYEIYRRRGEL